MRRKEIEQELFLLSRMDERGELTRDEQIDLWFKKRVFELSKDLKDEDENPLKEEDYTFDRELRLVNRPAGGQRNYFERFDPTNLPLLSNPTRTRMRYNTREFNEASENGDFIRRNAITMAEGDDEHGHYWIIELDE